MKQIFLATLIFLAPVLSSADDLAGRIAALEGRVQTLELAVAQKLSQCELTFKPHVVRLNRCDLGTFPRSVTIINEQSVQLECGYYQLKCAVQ